MEKRSEPKTDMVLIAVMVSYIFVVPDSAVWWSVIDSKPIYTGRALN